MRREIAADALGPDSMSTKAEARRETIVVVIWPKCRCAARDDMWGDTSGKCSDAIPKQAPFQNGNDYAGRQTKRRTMPRPVNSRPAWPEHRCAIASPCC